MERCRVCGNAFDALTFEHLPPSSAYNNRRVMLYGLQHWLERGPDGSVSGGKYQQRGAGNHSLCKDCNSLTGAWYVPEYAGWARRGLALLRQFPDGKTEDRDVNEKAVTIEFHSVYPLQFLKQVTSMLLSANPPEFGDGNLELRSFVRDKLRHGLSDTYQFYLVLYRGPYARQSAISGQTDLRMGAQHFFSEIAFPPFSLLLSLDETEPLLPIGNISHFRDYEYNKKANVEMEVQVGFGHTPYPADFRSMAAIERDRASQRD